MDLVLPNVTVSLGSYPEDGGSRVHQTPLTGSTDQFTFKKEELSNASLVGPNYRNLLFDLAHC